MYAQNMEQIPCALARCDNYGKILEENTEKIFLASKMSVRRGMKVLVKPNLLTAKALACTNPQIVALACKYLLDMGCKVEVADSPGFGRAQAVAHAIGLDTMLAPLGLKILPMDKPIPLPLSPNGSFKNEKTIFMVSRRACECDFILSVPKIKAHSQMRITLAMKNCFGCVCGMHKALIHARDGRNPDRFAACLAALWRALPPMGAFVDGIIAMSITGPSRGVPFKLGFVGACRSVFAMDLVLLDVLGIPLEKSPLTFAASKIIDAPQTKMSIFFPMSQPQDFDATGFVVPEQLDHTSFSPARLAKSLGRRLLAALKA